MCRLVSSTIVCSSDQHSSGELTLACLQDFYTHVVDYIADSDALNGTAFSNAALDPDGTSTPLSAGGDAQLDGLPKLVMQVPPSSI